MKYIFSSFSLSFKYLFKDKVILFFSMIPIILGSVLFYFTSNFIYKKGNDILGGYFKEYTDTSAALLGIIVKGLIFVLIYFLINWFFVIVVSSIAGPFNDLISSRVEKLVGGKTPEGLDSSIKSMIKNLGVLFFNEFKKISLIIILSILALILGLSTVLAPIGLWLSALLVSIAFIDYSWSRHELPVSSCVSDVFKNILAYSFTGMVFMFLIAIPILNLVILPYGVIYYTLLWSKANPGFIE